MITYSAEDIPYQTAYNAHRNTSWTPDKRADNERAEYTQRMAAIAAEFSQWVTPENETQMRADLEQFRAGYVKHLLALLGAQSRIASQGITGAGGWTAAMVRRNDNANATADKRRVEFLDYCKRLDRLRGTYDPRRIASAPIRSDDGDAVAKLQAKIAAAEERQAYMKAANVEARKNGAPRAFEPFELTNSNADIRRMKERIAALQAEAARRETLHEKYYDLGGATVIENAQAERLQIMFPSKPSPEMIARLKSRGFHWSREGVWQRLLNNAARYAAREVLGSE